jgi:hypothetical protein
MFIEELIQRKYLTKAGERRKKKEEKTAMSQIEGTKEKEERGEILKSWCLGNFEFIHLSTISQKTKNKPKHQKPRKPMALNMPMMPMGAEVGGDWQCVSCGFKNKGRNTLCGGVGNLGCKMPRARRADMGGVGGVMYGAPYGMPVAGMLPKGKWECNRCAFVNSEKNYVCGGRGGKLGCKKPRNLSDNNLSMGMPPQPNHQASLNEMAWECECGFKNRAGNDICGGRGGKLGCKKPHNPVGDVTDAMASISLMSEAPPLIN